MTEKTLDRFGVVGATIKVSRGHYVDLANPDPATIEIVSIAHALSLTCRFGGHCPQFYSVAEHCWLATALAAADGLEPPALLAILLHDAAEAYIGDVVKPLKLMLPDYAVIEARIERAVGEAFGVDFAEWADAIKHYDRLMLKAEKLAMWPDDAELWAGFDDIESRDVTLEHLPPPSAMLLFVEAFDVISKKIKP